MISAIKEIALMLVLVVPFVPTVRRLGYRQGPTLAVSVITAFGVIQIWTVILLALTLPTDSIILVSLTVSTGLLLSLSLKEPTAARDRYFTRALLVISPAACVLVYLPRRWELTRVTPDSIVHLAHIRLLRRGDGSILESKDLFERGIGTSAFHSLADLFNRDLFMSAHLALALATATLAYSFVRNLQKKAPVTIKFGVIVAFLCTLTLVFTDRFIFVSLLLNHHALVSLSYLTIVFVIANPLGQSGRVNQELLMGLALALISFAAVSARRESVLVIGFLAVLSLMFDSTTYRTRATWLVTLTVLTSFWSVTLLRSGSVTLAEVSALVLVPVLTLGVTRGWRYLRVFGGSARAIFLCLVGGYYLGLFGLTVLDSTKDLRLLSTSIGAVTENLLFSGGWRSEIILVAGVFVLARPGRDPQLDFIRYVVLGILLIHLGLPMLTGGAYRVGPGDSFNRMLTHILPLAVVYVGAVLSHAGPRRGVGGADVPL